MLSALRISSPKNIKGIKLKFFFYGMILLTLTLQLALFLFHQNFGCEPGFGVLCSFGNKFEYKWLPVGIS